MNLRANFIKTVKRIESVNNTELHAADAQAIIAERRRLAVLALKAMHAAGISIHPFTLPA